MGSLVDDELEEGEIREVEERSIVHFQNTLPFLDDFEEGEMRHKNVEGGEVMVSVQNAPAYFDDLEEGEIRDETDPFFVAVPCDQEPMVAQNVITVMELPPSKEITVREKACLNSGEKDLKSMLKGQRHYIFVIKREYQVKLIISMITQKIPKRILCLGRLKRFVMRE
jgi:hypothetical protein